MISISAFQLLRSKPRFPHIFFTQVIDGIEVVACPCGRLESAILPADLLGIGWRYKAGTWHCPDCASQS